MHAITPIANNKKEKPTRCCPRCGHYFQYRMPRPFIIKYLLFFLPLSKYFCGYCLKSRYVWGRRWAPFPPSKCLVQVNEEAFMVEFPRGNRPLDWCAWFLNNIREPRVKAGDLPLFQRIFNALCGNISPEFPFKYW